MSWNYTVQLHLQLQFDQGDEVRVHHSSTKQTRWFFTWSWFACSSSVGVFGICHLSISSLNPNISPLKIGQNPPKRIGSSSKAQLLFVWFCMACTPLKINMLHLKMMVWKMMFLFQGARKLSTKKDPFFRTFSLARLLIGIRSGLPRLMVWNKHPTKPLGIDLLIY